MNSKLSDSTGNFLSRQIETRRGVFHARHWPNPDAPVLVFAHANGFCASAYRQMLDPLATHYEIYAPDLRGHGQTRLAADPDRHTSWNIYAEDLAAICEGLPRRADILSGHSMGGICALLAADKQSTPPGLVLIDPVLIPRMMHWISASPLRFAVKNRLRIARSARQRSNSWPDRETVERRYLRHPNFARWPDGVVSDYLEDGLRSTETGVELACAPAWEAANYEAQGHCPFGALNRLSSQIHILKAENQSTVINRAAVKAAGVSMLKMSGRGHLAPMEVPSETAALIHERIQAIRDVLRVPVQ